MKAIKGRFSSLILATLLAGVSAGAAAQDDACANLSARVAMLDRQDASAWDTGTGAIDRSIEQQRMELERLSTQARRSGCMGGFLGLGRANANCPSLNARIGKVRASLNRLNAERRSRADPYAVERERSRLLQQMASMGCTAGGYAVYGGSGGRRGHGFFETVLGNGRIRTVWGPSDYAADDFRYGTFRTLCVRTCDGYYFPISFSTVQSRFADDEQTCQARCPGTDTALYVYRNPGADMSQAVSLAGKPYRSLDTAFRYRKAFDATCRCGAVVASAAPLQDISSYVTVPAIPAEPAIPLATYGGILPAPKERPPMAEDPETLANRFGHLSPAGEPADSGVKMVAGVVTVTPEGKEIRVIGPSFYIPRNSRPVPDNALPKPPDER